MPVPYRRLGRVVKTHGTDGEVSVIATGNLTVSHSEGDVVWIVPPVEAGATPRRIIAVRKGPKGPLVRLSGVETAASAHELVGRWLLVAGEEQPTAEDPDAFVGLEVHDAVRGAIGTVSEVLATGANDVLVVTGGPYGEVLIPVIDDVIVSIDDGAGTLAVRLLEGLIEEDGR